MRVVVFLLFALVGCIEQPRSTSERPQRLRVVSRHSFTERPTELQRTVCVHSASRNYSRCVACGRAGLSVLDRDLCLSHTYYYGE